jgi:pimeloyl-ACP methyl ester carboxylesterase
LTHSLLKREPQGVANGRLDQIQAPTLVIVGAGDHPDLHEHGQKLAAGIAGAELVEIPAAGHLPHFEQPDTFNPVVLEFLARHQLNE